MLNGSGLLHSEVDVGRHGEKGIEGYPNYFWLEAQGEPSDSYCNVRLEEGLMGVWRKSVVYNFGRDMERPLSWAHFLRPGGKVYQQCNHAQKELSLIKIER